MKGTLHTKYRPTNFDDFYGNEDLIKSLKSKVSTGNVSSILFYGPRGCGKTTLSRIVAKELGADKMSIKELDLASVGLKNKALEIRDKARFVPFGSNCKVWIFDEIQDSSRAFQASMLKELEEPTEGVYFILCTTEPEKLKDTIRSRCLSYKVKPLEGIVMGQLLRDTISLELGDEKDRINPDIIRMIARKSSGIPREALVLLDKIIDLDDDEDMKRIIDLHVYVDTSDEVKKLCQALMDGLNWKSLAPVVLGVQDNPEQARHAVLTWMSKVLLRKENPRAAALIELFSETYIYSGFSGLVLSCYYASKLDSK